MKTELEKQFAEAMKCQDDGQLESAETLYLELAKKDPQSVRVLAGLGSVYYDLERWAEAIDVFKRATVLSPALEGVSKGLFLSLWKSGKEVDALDEVRRFQSISDSEDYREIVREIIEKG